METTTNLSLADQIYLGHYDSQLDMVITAVMNRKRELARDVARSLRPGDIVHFSAAIRPRYLVGLEATVVRVNDVSVTVSCPVDPDYQRYSGARSVRCANAFIEELV